MAETEYQSVPRAFDEMIELINDLPTPLDGNAYRDMDGQLWRLWKKTMIDSGYTDIQVEMAKGPFRDLQARLDSMDSNTEIGLVNLQNLLQNFNMDWVNWNLKKINLTNLGEDVLQAMLGNTPINAVPADGSITTLKLFNKSVTNAKLSDDYAYVTTLETGTNMASVIAEGHYFKLANRTLIGGPVNLAGDAQLFITVNRISEFVTIQTIIDYLNPSVEYRRTIRSGGATGWIRVNLTVDEKSNLDAILLSGLTNFTPVNLLNTDYDLVKKLSAVREIEVIGVDPNTPVKIWFLSRNYSLGELPWHHRIYLGQKINGTWVKLLDTSALFVVDEAEGGPTQVEVTEGQVTVRLSIDYRLIPEGDRIVDGTQLAEEPNFVINPKNVKLTDEPENPFPDDFEVYDQSLNTFDSVTFTSLSTDVLDIGGQLPAGTLASPPTGLLKGDMWADTTDSATNPILRVKI